jgi:exopolyphosphatase/pppGpp-phosphohydrolase
VDLGSRAARLIIADVSRESVDIHISRGFLTMLGKGVNNDSLNRLKKALKVFSTLTQRAGIAANDVTAFGTEVFRKNPNLCQIVVQYFPEFRPISGGEEARYSFSAGLLSQKTLVENERVLVIDQGGGSLELSLGYKFEDLLVIEEAVSFPGFGTFNYPEDRRKFAEELILRFPTLEELTERKPKGLAAVIGMGSVVTQLAFLQSAKPQYHIEEVNGFVIEKPELAKRVKKQQSLGAFLDVLDHFYMEEMLVSGWGTRHGALFADRILVRK